jgi:hypothetical protein
MTSRYSNNNMNEDNNLSERERNIIQLFTVNGYSYSYARQATGIIINRDLANINASLLKH